MPLKMQPRRVLRLVWLLILLAVILGSLLPATSLPLRGLAYLNIGDKAQHFSAYALLAFLPALHERGRAVILFALGVVLLGLLLEGGQFLLSSGRFFEMRDVAADTVGACAGLAAGWPLRNAVR